MNTPSTLTLSLINSQLAHAGIPAVVNADTAARLKGLAARDRLVKAIFAAPKDKSEHAWLIDLLKRVGINVAESSTTLEPIAPPVDRQVPSNQDAARKVTDPQTTSERVDSPGPMGRDRQSVHVYGNKSALCFEPDTTKDGTHTVALDAALATGPRQYDWKRKIRVQLTVRELPIVAAVIFGFGRFCEFKNHGTNNDKGFSLENQEKNAVGQVFARVFAKDQVLRAVPIDAADAWRVGALFVRQLRQQYPWLDGDTLMMSLRMTGARIGPKPAVNRVVGGQA